MEVLCVLYNLPFIEVGLFFQADQLEVKQGQIGLEDRSLILVGVSDVVKGFYFLENIDPARIQNKALGRDWPS